MKIHHATRPYLSIFAWISLLPFLSPSLDAQVQRFEFDYGNNTCAEKGFRGVEPIDLPGGCCEDGYIAVGVTSEALIGSQCTPDDNVYVVWADKSGNPIREIIYDIGGFGGKDSGMAICEVPEGFVITGTTRRNEFGAKSEVFLLKIDCDGDVIFTQRFGDPEADEFARDLIVTEKGSGVSTNPGDYVIAGWADRGPVNQNDGLLIRTRSNGTLIWHKTYNMIGTDPDQHNEAFMSLIETKVTRAGDIVAVGFTDGRSFDNGTFFGLQGYVVRVSGNNGNFGLPPQGSANFGSGQNDRFETVQELSTASEAGRLVFAGSTTLPGNEDIYIVKTEANPCQLLAQNKIDHQSLISGSGEVAFDMVEVLTAGNSFCPVGDLAVVGRTSIACPDANPPLIPERHDDGLLMHVSSSTLQVVSGFSFGTQQGDCMRNQTFHSIKDVGHSDRGFIMAGFDEINPATIGPPPIPDPSDLYLVKTSGSGRTCCAEEWNFLQFDPEFDHECRPSITASPLQDSALVTPRALKFAPEMICDELDCADMPDDGGPGGGGSEIHELDDPSDDTLPDAAQPGFSQSGSLLLPMPAANGATSEKATTTGTIRAKLQAKGDK